MGRKKLVVKSSLALLATLFIIGTVSGTYLANSEDWQDVYSTSYHAYSENETPYFVRNNNLGVFNVLPYGEPVNIVESSSSPMVSGIESQVRNQGYEVGNVTMVDSANFELRPEDSENIIVVPEDYPSAALIAAPYARVTDSWVLIANGGNVDRVEQIVEDSESSVMIGDFNREISSALNGSVDERITSSSKFNLSVKVAKKYLERKESDRILIGSGNFISRDIMEGESPVLISGTNYLPERLESFLFDDPDHSIGTAVMIGNEMANVGQDIRDLNFTRDNETTDEKMTVFIKYGQARGDSSSIYAISLFPLPTGDVSLSIPSATYNPETGEVLITYRNTGESRMYQLTSFEIISDGEVIATGSDENPVFVGGNTNRTISYDTKLNGTIDDASVEFSTTYGTTPQQLDTYLTESGQFSPPLMTNLTTKEIEDSSNMSIGSVEYVKGLERFRVTVENHEDKTGFAQIRLTDVTVTGEQQSFSSDRKEVPAEGSTTFYIPAELDRIDLQQNQRVNTVISHGEERDLLVKSNVESRELEAVERTATSIMIGAAAVVLILIGGGFLAYRRLDIEIEVNS